MRLVAAPLRVPARLPDARLLRVEPPRGAVEDQGGQATPVARVATSEAGGASVPVQPGELTVTASVRVVFNFA